MGDGGSGRLSRWTDGSILEEGGGGSGANIGAAQSKGCVWVGSGYTEGDGYDPENS